MYVYVLLSITMNYLLVHSFPSVLSLQCDELRKQWEAIDMSVLKSLLEILKPIKLATTILCSGKRATLSLIMPLKMSILKQVTVADEYSNVIKEVKSLIYGNLAPRCVVAIQSFNKRCYL